MNKHFASYNVVILCVNTRPSITRTISTQSSEIRDWNTVRFFLATRGKLSKTEVEKASTHLNPVRQIKSGAGENRCHGGQSRPQHAQHCHLISLKASLLCLRRWFLAVSLRLSVALFSSILLAHRQRNCYSKRGSRRDPGEDSASHTDVFEARSSSTLAKSTCHLEVRNLASSSSCSLSWRTLATELSSLIAERLGEDLRGTARTHFLHWKTRTRRNVAFGRRSRVEYAARDENRSVNRSVVPRKDLNRDSRSRFAVAVFARVRVPWTQSRLSSQLLTTIHLFGYCLSPPTIHCWSICLRIGGSKND